MDKSIQKISGGKSALLPVRRRTKHPSFKVPSAPILSVSTPKQFRQPQPSWFRRPQETLESKVSQTKLQVCYMGRGKGAAIIRDLEKFSAGQVGNFHCGARLQN